MIDIQSLNDAIIAVVTTVGIAVAVSIAITLASLLHRRQTVRAERVAGDGRLIQHPTQTDDARELVLR